MHKCLSILLFAQIFIGCSLTVKVIDNHPNNAKKSSEIYNGKLFGSKLIKKTTHSQSGRILSETSYSNNKKHGKHITYHENGKIAAQGNFKSGLRSGRWEWNDKNGTIDSIYTFKNGKYHGKNENYFKGILQISQRYSDGKMNGKFTEYTEQGFIKSKGEYRNNLPYGKWEWLDRDKKIQRVINYKNGIKDGGFKIYSEDNLSLSGYYLKDKRHKIWKWYDSEGRIDSIANYSSGKLDGEYKVWHDNRELKISGFFRQNKFNGEWKWFSETGQTDSVKAMSNGLLDGPSKFYFKNGQLKEKSSYKLGKLNGEKSTYYISGQLKSKTKYRLNEKMGPFEVWTSNGQLEERGTFLKNQYHGIVQRNYSTGLLASATTYSRGKLEGISQIFSPSNFLKKESFFTTNNEIARLEYHDNGRFKRVLIIKGDNIVYERKWNIDGFEVTDQNFITGTRTQSDYYLSGQLKYECIYKNEMKHGMEWWLGEDRNPTKINLFNNGILIISHDLSYVGNE